MSSISDVRAATCRVVGPNGSFRGTGFFVLPGGCLLTCHHVVFGLEALHVQIPGGDTLHPAEYLAECSNPVADIAVLRVPGIEVSPVQLGRARAGCEALGYGFRPGSLANERSGHSFSGEMDPGQILQIEPSAALKAQLDAIAPAHRRPWNQLPNQYRIGDVRNFHAHGLLERGISGGPIYDPQLRRVVGLFRAIEGDETAYVIPMDDAFATWAALEKKNREEVSEPLLDQILVKHRLTLVHEGARPIMPLAWDTFAPLFKYYARFGGRSKESDAFKHLLNEQDRGFSFVTGLAGFGKTALLAHWAQTLRESSDLPVIHFISPLIRGATDEAFCLQNLCEQLMAIHGLGGDVPQDVRRLRTLYADLLRLSPPRHRVIVFLDGLDEALGEWTPDAGLFPPDLGAGVYVVFSARQMADKDWLATVGLSAGAVQVLELGKLTLGDINDVLVQMRLLSTNADTLRAVAERLLVLTEGDPFYLQDLIKDMEVKGASLNALQPYRVGHINYLKEWWKTAVRKHPDQSFVDLMGTLAALRAPLGRTELVRISDEDRLTGANIDVLLEDAARYIQGNKETGYQLAHGRIRSFIQETLDRDFAKYRTRVADFCQNWNREDPTDLERQYALLHAVPHLIEAGRTAEAISLLTRSPDWMNAKAMGLGSDWSLAADFDRALPLASDLVDLVKLRIAAHVVRERVELLVDLDLKALVWLGRDALVLGQVRLRKDAGTRFRGLVVIYEEFKQKESPKPELLDEAEDVAHLIVDRAARADAFRELGTLRFSISDSRWRSAFVEARRLAATVDDEFRRSKALRELADAMRMAKDEDAPDVLEAAHATAKKIVDDRKRSEALHGIAVSLAAAQRPEDALHMLESVGLNRLDADMVRDVVTVSYQSGCMAQSIAAQAQALAERIDHVWGRERILARIAAVHALMGEQSAYEALLLRITNDGERSEAERYRAKALAKSGDIDAACRIAASTAVAAYRADALGDIAQAALKTGHERMDEIVAEAVATTLEVDSSAVDCWRVIALAKVLLRGGQAKKAMEMIRSVPHGFKIGKAITELDVDLSHATKSGDTPLLTEMLEIARKLDNEHWRVSALRTVALCFAKTQDQRAGAILKEVWTAAGANQQLPAEALLRISDALAHERLIAPLLGIVGSLEDPCTRVTVFGQLVTFLRDAGDNRWVIVLDDAVRESGLLKREEDRVAALISLIGPLSRTEDPRLQSVIDEVEELGHRIPNFPSSSGWKDEDFFPNLRVAKALADLTLALAEARLFDRALATSRSIGPPDLRSASLAQVAVFLAKVSDPRSDEIFSEARVNAEKGRYAPPAMQRLIFGLAEVGRFDDACAASRVAFREEDRSWTLAGLTRMLVEANRLENASEVAHTIENPRARAQALVDIAGARAGHDADRIAKLLDEVRELSRSVERPDLQASVLEELVRGLAEASRFDDAIQLAESITLPDFRAGAFMIVAQNMLVRDRPQATAILEKAVIEAHAIPDRSERQRILGLLADAFARAEDFRGAFAALHMVSLDEFIVKLACWAPLLRRRDPKLPLEVLREAAAIAAWNRADWQEICKFLPQPKAHH